jgi:AraC-like DNA-binding protein
MITSIHEMPARPADYFRYFAPGPEVNAWGIALTAAGHTRIAPHAPYPPGHHPADHQFDWAQGRVLESPQIVLITAGSGQLEVNGRRHEIATGMAFGLPPRVRHRYRPHPETGWEESWIEVEGPIVRELLRARLMPADSLVRSEAVAAGLDDALEAVHARARRAGAGFDAELAAAAYRVIAVWDTLRTAHHRPSRITTAVDKAQRYLAEHLAEPVNIAALARRQGVAYSHFRRAFKQQTGLAPWQYVLHLRLTHARRALAAGDATLDEIASRFGFSSAFHFSTAFKRAQGVAPAIWRAAHRG